MHDEVIHVLLVEDNPADARLLVESLKDAGPFGFRVTHVTRLSAAIEALADSPAQVVLLDLSLPDSTGLRTIELLRASAPPGIPVVVLTGLHDEALALQAVRAGVQDYLVKGHCEEGLAARAVRYAVARQRAEAALRDNEARLRAVVDTAVDAIITIDERGEIDSVNPATERLFGYAAIELVGQNVAVLMPDPYRGEHDAYLTRYLRTGDRRIIGHGREVVGLRKDGSLFPIDLAVSEFWVGQRRMFTGIVHDISGRRQLQQQVLEASIAEQRRIGHELHDGLCQQLAGAAFAAEILARRLEGEAPGAVPKARQLGDEIDQAITQARALARGLNPIEVHAGGLAPTLQDLAGKVSATYRIDCRFEQYGEPAVADNTSATHLYRIAQEAISNAIRHGKATVVELTLHGPDGSGGGSLSLSVNDNGVGFAPNVSPVGGESAAPDGIGLQTMAYRAKMVNGVLSVRPGRNGRGVVVTCSIPLEHTKGTHRRTDPTREG